MNEQLSDSHFYTLEVATGGNLQSNLCITTTWGTKFQRSL